MCSYVSPNVLAHYVGICRERFKDRLVFETQVTEEALRGQVPFFILQPLVENALQHGIARRSGRGHVTVSAERRGDNLQLWVKDDGPGLDDLEQPFPVEGIGLSNIRSRLRQLYGDHQQLTLEQHHSQLRRTDPGARGILGHVDFSERLHE